MTDIDQETHAELQVLDDAELDSVTGGQIFGLVNLGLALGNVAIGSNQLNAGQIGEINGGVFNF